MTNNFTWPRRNMILFNNWYAMYHGALVAKLRNGLVMRIPSRHDIPILWEVFGDRCYKDIKGDVIVDIGANIGCFSLLAAKENPGATIYAYEASSDNAEIMQENVSRNNMENRVHVYPLAVAGSQGVRDFHLAKHGDSGHNSFYRVNDDDGIARVPCVTLDAIIEQLGEIDYVKIDVEGAEREILEACTLLDKVKHIVIEGDESIGDLLVERGFEVSNPEHLIIIGNR